MSKRARHGEILEIIKHHRVGSQEALRELLQAQDIDVTRRVHAAGRVLGIRLLDHLVVAGGGYRSIAEMGELRSWTDSCSVTGGA